MDRLFRVDFYPQDWLVDTSRLTPEQRGIFIQIVALIYAKRGKIDNDPMWIAGQCGCSPRLVKTILGQLSEKGFVTISDEKIGQKRAEDELNKKRTHIEHSAKGGRTRRENERESIKNKDLTLSASQESPPTPKAIAKAIAIANESPPPPTGIVEDKAKGVPFPYARFDKSIPSDLGSWALQEMNWDKSRLVDVWTLFHAYYTNGKGQKIKTNEVAWVARWRNWCRKEGASFGGGFDRPRPEADKHREGRIVL